MEYICVYDKIYCENLLFKTKKDMLNFFLLIPIKKGINIDNNIIYKDYFPRFVITKGNEV